MEKEYPGTCVQGKGDPLVCGSYRAIKLLEQLMKVLERVLEKRIRCQVTIDSDSDLIFHRTLLGYYAEGNMQLGFMPGNGTIDAIFIMRQVQGKHQAEKKETVLCFCGFREGI